MNPVSQNLVTLAVLDTPRESIPPRVTEGPTCDLRRADQIIRVAARSIAIATTNTTGTFSQPLPTHFSRVQSLIKDIQRDPQTYTRLKHSDPLRTNISVQKAALQSNPSLFFQFPNLAKQNTIFRMAAFLLAKFKKDHELCRQLNEFDQTCTTPCLVEFKQEIALINDMATLIHVLKQPTLLTFNREAMLACITATNSSYLWYWIDGYAQQDRNFILQALRYEGKILEHLTQEQKADREIVLTAVQQAGWTICFAAPELQNDPEIQHILSTEPA